MAYDVVVFMDTDIDIVRLDETHFHHHLQSFAESSFIISGQNDWAVPLNTGAFVIKPSTTIFRRGLEMVIGHASTGGFHHLGAPRSLFNNA